MANITETNDWPAGVYQYAIGDIVDGGPDSLETLPLRQLAHRSLYQRLANVTPWDSVLASLYGYPAGACVMHSGASWRAKVANDVEPGTDAAKWERWGYSESELDTKIGANYTGSIGPIGWQRLPSGLILQWGYTSSVANTSDAAVSPSFGYYGTTNVIFPIAFPAAVLHIGVGRRDAGVTELSGHTSNRSQTGFTLWVNNAQAGVWSVSDWLAIGY